IGELGLAGAAPRTPPFEFRLGRRGRVEFKALTARDGGQLLTAAREAAQANSRRLQERAQPVELLGRRHARAEACDCRSAAIKARPFGKASLQFVEGLFKVASGEGNFKAFPPS